MPGPVARVPDIRQDGLLVGRKEDLSSLVRNLARGRHVLITGESGVGKSRLMYEAVRVLRGTARRIECAGTPDSRLRSGAYHVLYLEEPLPLQGFVRELLELLFEAGDLSVESDGERDDWEGLRKQLTRLEKVKLHSLIAEGIFRSAKKYVVFVDNLERVTPAQQKFLETILGVAAVCAAASQPKETAATRRFWSSFVRMDLAPLSAAESRELVDHLFREYGVRSPEMEMYRRELLAASNGSPQALKTMAWHCSRENAVSLAEIRALRASDESPLFNMGPIYVFGLAAFTLMKILSFGMDNIEFYIYFSVLGLIAFMVFRVYRQFFVFRPNRRS